MLINVKVPFPGYYNTLLSDIVDHLNEREIDWLLDYYDEAIYDAPLLDAVKSAIEKDAAGFNSRLIDAFWRHEKTFLSLKDDINECWVVTFFEELKDQTGVDLAPNLKSLKMTSPREYNFETDSLFCDVDLAALKSLIKKYRDEIEAHVKVTLAPRDGFWPFYPNTIEAWPADVTEWGPARLGLALEAVDLLLGVSDYTEWETHEYITANNSSDFDCDIDDLYREALSK